MIYYNIILYDILYHTVLYYNILEYDIIYYSGRSDCHCMFLQEVSRRVLSALLSDIYGLSCHILPPSEIDWRLCLFNAFAGSEIYRYSTELAERVECGNYDGVVVNVSRAAKAVNPLRVAAELCSQGSRLYYTILDCTRLLDYTILYYTILYYTILCCMIWRRGRRMAARLAKTASPRRADRY